MTLRLDWCSHKAAKAACERWHYSGTIPTPPLLTIGVWEDGKYIGAVVFGRGANNNLGKPYGLVTTEVCELVRVALTGHKAPVSRILAVALKMLKAQHLRLCVSYADPAQGHVGGIYQAGGWLYAGQTSPDRYYVTHDGARVHSRMVCERGVKRVYGVERRVLTPADCREKHTTPGKHRYLMPLDAAMRAQIEPLRKPYPKRPKPSSEAAGHQLAEGGAEPTRTLQTSNEQ